MKLPSTLLVAAAFLTASLPAARAITPDEYWDPGHLDQSPGSGGTGVWDDATPNWTRGYGQTAYVDNILTLFSGQAGTINLAAGDLTAYGVVFSTPGYVLQDSSGTSDVLNSTGGVQATMTSGTVTISAPLTLMGSNSTSSNYVAANVGGTLAISGNITAPRGLSFGFSGGAGGGGTVILSGSDTVTGTTTIYSGTVKLGGTSVSVASSVNRLGGASPVTAAPAQVLSSTSNVVIQAGTLLYAASNQLAPATPMTLSGGTFNLGTFSQDRAHALGALTLSADSAIDFGTGASMGGTVAFADSSAIAWSGKLSIYDFHGTPLVGGGLDQLSFGTNAGGLTPAQLADITFYAGGPGSAELGTGVITSDGEVTYTPDLVPEAMMGLGAGLLGLTLRRRAGRA